MVPIEATLCTGRKIVVRELETKDEELALQSLGANANMQNPAMMKKFMQEMIKMMMVEVDGKPVTYQQMSEKSLGEFFSVKEIRQLETLYQKLHVPTPEEDASFFLTIKPLSTAK